MAETGKLIVLEGVDDTALTLLGEELGRWMREHGLSVEETREPTYGPAGIQILLARQGREWASPLGYGLVFTASTLLWIALIDWPRADSYPELFSGSPPPPAGRHIPRSSGLDDAKKWKKR